MSQSLLAFDTDHIKNYVFGTGKLKEIRGASSLLDYLNRKLAVDLAESDRFKAKRIYANGGSGFFLVDSELAEELGSELQQLYQQKTGGGASITYVVQPIPGGDRPDIMTATGLEGGVTMQQVLKLLGIRLRLAKDTMRSGTLTRQEQEKDERLVLPSHSLLVPCKSCGVRYAEDTRPDLNDPDEPEGLYCQVCIKKRDENKEIKYLLQHVKSTALSDKTLWGRILRSLNDSDDAASANRYALPPTLTPPKDFHAFRDLATRKGYFGLIYADANAMGSEIEEKETLEKVKRFAKEVDDAVFKAMGDAIRAYLPVKNNALSFDILLIGGDDIVMVTPAEKALHVAHALAERFHFHTDQKYTLSVSVLLAPISYPFSLQNKLVEEAIKAAKKPGATRQISTSNKQGTSSMNFMVVTGSTSLNYEKVYEEWHPNPHKQKKGQEFYATMRPYSLDNFKWLLERLREGNEKRLGRTKLHQLREAILKVNRTTTILEALALLRNWKGPEREFIREMVAHFDTRSDSQRQQETLFPWYPDARRSNAEHTTYCTPLLDFIELYDFVSTDVISF